MATTQKIRNDIAKTKEKIEEKQKRLRALDAQLAEEENLEIVRMVKAVKMDNKELTAFLKAVSYTHLDVYKRQGHPRRCSICHRWSSACPPCSRRIYSTSRTNRACLQSTHRSRYNGFQPVSYTHLDVYKRQSRG